MWDGFWDNEEFESRQDRVEKQSGERKEMVREESEDIMEIEDSEVDGDGSEMDEIEEGEVMEIQGKGKGKEKVMEDRAEENTLA
jgi:hypothetical protein